MRNYRHVALFAAVVALVGTCFSQTSRDDSFKSQTNLVLVPVVITRDGKHIKGLDRASFSIKEQGVAREIAGFEEVDRLTPQPALAETDGFRNRPTNASPERITVLLLDLINTPYQKQEFSRAALIRFLLGRPNSSEPMLLAALTPEGLKVVHQLTSNPNNLMAALTTVERRLASGDLDHSHAEAAGTSEALQTSSSIHGRFDDDEAGKLTELVAAIPKYLARARDLDRTMETLRGLRQLADALAGWPGRKSLIWVTGGLSFADFSPDPDTSPLARRAATFGAPAPPRAAEANDEFERTWALLGNANTAVYPIDLSEVTNPSFTEAMYRMPHPMGTALLRSQAMLGFTTNTGGKYCELQATLENCFRAAMHDSEHYYLLSFYAQANGKPGWHSLQVKVAAPGAQVRARSGFFADRSLGDGPTRERRIQSALLSPLDATAIALSARWLGSTAPSSGKLSFELSVDPGAIELDGAGRNHFRVTVVAAAGGRESPARRILSKSLEGTIPADKLNTFRSEGLVYRDAISLPAGTTSIRFVVRDETSGRIGAVTRPVQ